LVDRELSRNFLVDPSRRQVGHPCVTVIITQTNHTIYPVKVGYFNLKENSSVHVHYKESSLLHSLLPLYRLSRNAS